VLRNYPDEVETTKSEPFVAVELEQYATPSPRGTATTFRPKIFDTDMEAIDFSTPGLPNKYELNTDYAVPTKRAEPRTDVDTRSVAQRLEETLIEPVAETEADTNFQTAFKLNAVGMVAVVSFIAVTLLVIAFIIANSISISGANSRIGDLQAANSALVQDIGVQQQHNAQTYQTRAQDARDAVADPANGFAPVTPTQIPPAPAWTPAPTNPEQTSNFFDQISRFFSRLFVG